MDDAGIYAREVPGLERAVQIGVAGSRVISVSFPREPDPGAKTDHDVLDRIEAYFDGAAEALEDVTVALTVPTDQRAVLEALQSVPYGESVTIERLTRMAAGLDAEDPESQETTRRALGANPAPLLLPDHRVSDAEGPAPAEVADRLRELEGIA